ncbi:MAG: hypothetical protein K6E91_01090 [Butyrivibrio sp.]|nr:hypothetical protein [Butyrivibrio sp.]
MPPKNINQIRRSNSMENMLPPAMNDAMQIQRVENPIQMNPVNTDIAQVQLRRPSDTRIRDAYAAIGFDYEDSDKKRQALLNKSNAKYTLQRALREKETAVNAAPRQIQVTAKAAMELSDSKLVNNYGRYTGECADYLRIRYSLMRNRYYALLPVEELRALDRGALLSKLRAEYTKAQRSADLIAFYQDLIRLKMYDDSKAGLNKDRPNRENPPLVISADERNKNRLAYNNNNPGDSNTLLGHIDRMHISDAEKVRRRQVLKAVMRPEENDEDNGAIWQESDLRRITPKQQEGLRRILAWIFRNSIKSRHSQEPLAYKLAQATPEQLLLTFYLVENRMQYAPNPELIHKAITGYVPDLDIFKSRMISSKAKFWRRLDSDAVFYWSKLGMAARFALNCDIVTDYKTFSDRADELSEEIEDTEGVAEKARLTCDYLVQKGNILITLYRSAGLSPDMPADLIEDPTLKAKVLAINNEILEKLRALGDLNVLQEGQDFDRDAMAKQAGKKESRYKSMDTPTKKYIDQQRKYINGLSKITKIDKIIGGKVENFFKADAFKVSTSGISCICGAIGLLNTIMGIGEAGSYIFDSDRTGADRLNKAITTLSGLAGIYGVGASGADVLNTLSIIDIGKAPKVAPEEIVSWWGNTNIIPKSEYMATMAGQIAYYGGIVSIATGTVTALSGAIDVLRGSSSRDDIEKARTALRSLQQDHPPVTRDERRNRARLRAFMNHQDRAITNQESSGAVKIIGGLCTAGGGYLAMTGILALLGGTLAIAGVITSVGFGMIRARKKKYDAQARTVDEVIGLKNAIRRIKQEQGIGELDKDQETELRREVRQQILADMGYATYREAFSDFAKQSASLLYDKVFKGNPTDSDYSMYYDALTSVGFKIKKKGPHQKENVPTVKMIYSKLMG